MVILSGVHIETLAVKPPNPSSPVYIIDGYFFYVGLAIMASQQEKYEQWFKAVDTDGSGSLAYSELNDFLTQQRGYSDKQVEVITK